METCSYWRSASNGADDLVVADLLELRLSFDAALTALLDLESQDLTGLALAAS